MNTITLYKITCTKAYMIDEQWFGFSLEPWSGDTAYYEGYDDGGKQYEFPEGFKVCEMQAGELGIFDAAGAHYTLSREGHTPLLVSSGKTIYLRKAEEEMITVAQAGTITGISGSHLRKMCVDGDIPGAKLYPDTLWLLPKSWAEAHKADSEESFVGYMLLADAAKIANISCTAMRAAAERGEVIAKRQEVNKRGKWWINTSDPSFAEYAKKASARSRWVKGNE